MSNTAINFPGLGLSFDPPRSLGELFGALEGSFLGNVKLYGVVIAVGFMLAVIYGLAKSEKFGFTRDDLIDILIVAVPSGIIGARLYFCLFHNPEYYFSHPIEILYIWKGGLAIYGGIIFGLGSAAIVAAVKKIKPLAVLDVASIAFPLAQAIGRWGNFFNREAFGAPTDSILRMEIMTNSTVSDWDPVNGVWTAVHPCFLHECVWNLIGFTLLHFLAKKRKFDGQVFLMYVAWYGLGRMFIESLRTDSLLIGNYRVSQILAAVSALAAVVLLVVILLRKPDPRKMQVEAYERAKARKVLEQAAEEMSAYTEGETEPVSPASPIVDSSASTEMTPDAEITFEQPPAPEDEDTEDKE